MTVLATGYFLCNHLLLELAISRAHPYDARWDADRYRERWDGPIDDRVGPHDRPVADRDSVEHFHTRAEPNVITDVDSRGDRSLLDNGDLRGIEAMLGGHDHRTRRDHAPRADANSTGTVQRGKTVDRGPRADLYRTQLAIDQYVVVQIRIGADVNALSAALDRACAEVRAAPKPQ